MTGIVVRDLCVRFDEHHQVLDHCSLEVSPGEIVALLGGSGSGKSTLLRAIAKLQPITSGEVRFTGRSPMRRAGDLAYVFQDATLLPWRTAEQNVRLPLELAGASGQRASDLQRHDDGPTTDEPTDQPTHQLSADASSDMSSDVSPRSVTERVREALTAVGLAQSSWGKFPRQLSGGMRMRVSLARAIVTDPAILLLDEPFAALDEILRTRMNDLLIELWMRRRRTILFVTHNIAEAVNLSARLAILGQGRIAQWIDNPLPIPRDNQIRSSPEFARMYADVSAALSSATPLHS